MQILEMKSYEKEFWKCLQTSWMFPVLVDNLFKALLVYCLYFTDANTKVVLFLSSTKINRLLTHLPSCNAQTVLCIVILDFFVSLKIWVPKTYKPLHIFQLSIPAISDFLCPNREHSKSLKVGIRGFKSLLTSFLEIRKMSTIFP